MTRLFLFLICFVTGFSDYKFEGIWQDCDDRRPFFMSFFLPYNPVILSYDLSPETRAACTEFWPKATFTYAHDPLNLKCDLLWIDNERRELDILQSSKERLQKTNVVYTSTHAEEFQGLRSFLESFGFTLGAHWYWEGQNGHAVFVKKDIFDAAMRTLNYSPNPKTLSAPASYNLTPLFSKAPYKSKLHSMDQIDFIYMINLDERPEKFKVCESELGFYGIHPYRFSAVNGWKLPAATFSQIGAKVFSKSIQEQFMGSIYKNIDGQAFLSNELIRPNGEAYFLLGMSRGAIGIVLSHLSVLQDAYDAGFNTIWVMEDDVEVIGNPWQIPELIKMLDEKVPDWDIFFTDIDTKDKNGKRVACRALAARPNYHLEPLDFYLKRFYPINDHLSSCGMRYGAYSMIVRRSAMKKILDYYKSYGIFIPYDMDYWLIPNIKMYTVNKDIVSTRVGAPTDNHAPGYSSNF